MACGKGPLGNVFLKKGPLGEKLKKGTLVGQLLSTPKLPEIPDATPMPTADSSEVNKARRRSLATQRKRSGRASTVLTQRESLG